MSRKIKHLSLRTDISILCYAKKQRQVKRITNITTMCALAIRYQQPTFGVHYCRNDESVCHAKPFVKWAGGKRQLLLDLAARIPKDFETNITTYIEPFVGGGAFLFWIAEHFQNLKRFIINDVNPALVNVYQTIRDTPQPLVAELKELQSQYDDLSSEDMRKELYLRVRDAFNVQNSLPTLQAAFFIFLNHTCFNGLYRVNAKGLFNVPSGKYAHPQISDEENIYAVSKVLAKAEIMTGDFTQAVAEADQYSFVYFDPPYRPLSMTSSFCSYSEDGFTDNEQRRLAKCCRELNSIGVRWLLSNSDPKNTCPEDTFFDDLYHGFNIQRVSANRMINSNASKRGKLSELLISNY